jgi:hypothetical protein
LGCPQQFRINAPGTKEAQGAPEPAPPAVQLDHSSDEAIITHRRYEQSGATVAGDL